MLRGLIRIITWAFLAYIVFAVYRFIKSLGRRREADERGRRKPAEGVMVKDEVCNTYLSREDALREIKGGVEHFFCSPECRKKFLEGRAGESRPSSPGR